MLNLFAQVQASAEPIGYSTAVTILAGAVATLAGVIGAIAKTYRSDMLRLLEANQAHQEKTQEQFAKMLAEQNSRFVAELERIGESVRELSCHGANQ